MAIESMTWSSLACWLFVAISNAVFSVACGRELCAVQNSNGYVICFQSEWKSLLFEEKSVVSLIMLFSQQDVLNVDASACL